MDAGKGATSLALDPIRLQEELLGRLLAVEGELSQLRSLLSFVVPADTGVASNSTPSLKRRKIGELEAPGRLTVAASGTDHEYVHCKRGKGVSETALTAEDGISVLPPEIWTHILCFVARCVRPQPIPSSPSPSPPRHLGEESQQDGLGGDDGSSEEDDEQDDQGDDEDGHVHAAQHHANHQQEIESSYEGASGNVFSGPLGAATLVCRVWRKVQPPNTPSLSPFLTSGGCLPAVRPRSGFRWLRSTAWTRGSTNSTCANACRSWPPTAPICVCSTSAIAGNSSLFSSSRSSSSSSSNP
jgi:hypothetical protein